MVDATDDEMTVGDMGGATPMTEFGLDDDDDDGVGTKAETAPDEAHNEIRHKLYKDMLVVD